LRPSLVFVASHHTNLFAPTHPRANATMLVVLQDISEDLKLSLNGRIELALADQGWAALAAQLRRNDHLNVRRNTNREFFRETVRHLAKL